MAIHQRIVDALKAGGLNLSFPFYNYNEPEIQQFYNGLQEIANTGAKHIRITTSMESFEVGTTGTVNQERFNRLIQFMLEAKNKGLVSIFDMHNTGMKDDDGNWTDDYMGRLRNAGVRTRYKNLAVALIRQLNNQPALKDWLVFTPANEPIFTNSAQEADIWWNFQKELIPALRAAAPTMPITYMANDWNGIEAFVYGWDSKMKSFAANDANLIIDVHFYEPVDFTHASSATYTYPGNIPSWRGTENWNKALIKTRLKLITDFAQQKGLPLVLLSEYGTNISQNKDSRLAYIRDVSDAARELGMGFTLYTWSWGDSFRINTDSRIYSAAFKGTVAPPPDPDPEPEPEPTDPNVLQRLNALESELAALRLLAIGPTLTTLQTDVAAIKKKLTDVKNAL